MQKRHPVSMKYLVMSFDNTRLCRFLSSHSEQNERTKYLLYQDDLNQVNLLNSYGLKPVQQIEKSREDQDAFLREYLGIVGSFAEVNGHNILWWATDFASKNRFTSQLPPLLEAVDKSMSAIFDTSHEQVLVLVQPPGPVVNFLKQWCKQQGVKVVVYNTGLVNRLGFIFKSRIGALNFLVKSSIYSLRRIFTVRKYFRRWKPRVKSGAEIYLIKSFTYGTSFKTEDSYMDPFFGKLKNILARKLGEKNVVLTVSVVHDSHESCYTKMSSIKDRNIVPLEFFLRYQDVFVAFIKIVATKLLTPFLVPDQIKWRGYDLTSLFQKCLVNGEFRIDMFQFLHQKAAERIAVAYSLSACAMTYEGNPWERMFILGIRKNSRAPVIGYQHTVIPPAAAGMFLTEQEDAADIPVPDSLVASGPAPAAIVKRYGSSSRMQLKVGGTLRYDYLYCVKMLERFVSGKNEFNVLVALEGVLDVLPLVYYVLEQASIKHSVRFCIRAHPVFPFDRLLQFVGWAGELPGNIEISHGKTVQEDVAGNHAVLYWGTTIALESLMMGRPVIHFDRGDSLSYDPLHDFESFKWTVRAGEEITQILKKISFLSKDEYRAGQESGRQYVEQYFVLPDDQSLENFF